MRNLGRWMVVGVASIAGVAGMVALGGTAEAAGASICPRVYAPVMCGNGKTYTNPCVAKTNHATDCVSVPWQTPQIPIVGKHSVFDRDDPGSDD